MSNVWLLLLAAVVAEVIGTTALKLSDGMRHVGPTVVVAVAYGLAFWWMSLVLRSLPVAVVYAVWSGLGIALTGLIGWLWFRQVLGTGNVVGIVLILAGVVVLAACGAEARVVAVDAPAEVR